MNTSGNVPESSQSILLIQGSAARAISASIRGQLSGDPVGDPRGQRLLSPPQRRADDPARPGPGRRQQIDTTTPTGRLAFHILGAIDEFQRELISVL